MNHVIYAVKARYMHLKIRHKFLITYLILIMIPLLLIGMVYYQYFFRNIEQQSSRLALQTLRQTEMHIDFLLKEVETLSSVFFSNVDMQDMLRKRYSNYEDVNDYKKLLNQIDIIKNNKQVYDVRLYVNDDKLYARDNHDIYPLSSLKDDKYYNSFMSTPECNSFWTVSHPSGNGTGTAERVLSFVTVIRDYSNIREVVGCLYIEILDSNFKKVLRQIDFGDNNHLFVFNGDMEVVTSTNTDESYLKLIDKISLYLKNNSLQENYKIMELGDEKLFVIFSRMERFGWIIVNTVPTSEIFHETNMIAVNSFIFQCLIIIFGALIAIWLSNAMTRRIEMLTARIRTAYNCGWNSSAAAGKDIEINDEITVLSVNYDSMLQRINQLIKENYEVQVARKEEQLKALQAHINPHFLYNTFDMINWMAIRSNAMNISETISMMADFYRIGLSDGREILPLCEEFRHAELYIELQKKRQYFESSIKLPENLKHFAIVKLIVQPLVENAIVHGISKKPDQLGKLAIDARQEENEIVIRVYDNAAEIDLERVQTILENKEQTSGTYGLKNVDERLKLYFGDKFGLKYGKTIREDGAMWTVAEIHIPLKEYNEKLEVRQLIQ